MGQGAGRVGDLAKVDSDSHGCPACPHTGIGPAIMGSATVNINGMPALTKGDQGVHAACCGTNMWKADAGSGTVNINGKAAHRKGDKTSHCSISTGELKGGSSDVLIG